MPQQQIVTGIHTLPVELVAQVLQFVPQRQRLQHCALVSTTWREAAAAATQSITVSRLCQEQLSLLSEWLLAHGAAGQLTHLGVIGCHAPNLQLPDAAISKLRSLELGRLHVTKRTAGPAERCSLDIVEHQLESWKTGVILTVSELTALTSLKAIDLTLDLRNMSACRLLKRLALDDVIQPDDVGASLSSTVASTLPALTDLTMLELTGSYDVSVAAHISSLGRLQELSLKCDVDMLGKAAAALPPSLTSLSLTGSYDVSVAAHISSLGKLQELSLKCDVDTMGKAAAALPPSLTSLSLCSLPFSEEETTLSLGKYTNLQSLSVTKGCFLLSSADVARLTQLRTCIIGARNMAAPAAEAEEGNTPSGLSVLAALTALQHLSLEKWLVQGSPWHLSLSAADCAALTASTQLTYLGLSQWQLPRELCDALLPAGRVLPHLQELQLGPCFLRDAAGAAALAHACPRLTSLVVAAEWNEYSYLDDYVEEQQPQEYDPDVIFNRPCLDGLAQLQSLQRLCLKDVQLVNAGVWGSIAQLTGLTEMRAAEVRIACLPGILQLTALEDLRVLQLDFGPCYMSAVLSMYQDCFMPFSLPAAVVRCAADLLEMAIEGSEMCELQQLLKQVPDLCAAAVESGWELQQHLTATMEGLARSSHQLKGMVKRLSSEERDAQVELRDIDEALQAAVEAEQTEAGSSAPLSPGQLARWQQQWEERAVSPVSAQLTDALCSVAADNLHGLRLWQELCRLDRSQANALQSAIRRCKECAKSLREEASVHELAKWITL